MYWFSDIYQRFLGNCIKVVLRFIQYLLLLIVPIWHDFIVFSISIETPFSLNFCMCTSYLPMGTWSLRAISCAWFFLFYMTDCTRIELLLDVNCSKSSITYLKPRKTKKEWSVSQLLFTNEILIHKWTPILL